MSIGDKNRSADVRRKKWVRYWGKDRKRKAGIWVNEHPAVSWQLIEVTFCNDTKATGTRHALGFFTCFGWNNASFSIKVKYTQTTQLWIMKYLYWWTVPLTMHNHQAGRHVMQYTSRQNCWNMERYEMSLITSRTLQIKWQDVPKEVQERTIIISRSARTWCCLETWGLRDSSWL